MQGWGLSVFAFSFFFSIWIDWLHWHSVSLVGHTWACTHVYTLTKSQEEGHNAFLPPPSSEDVFFILPLSQTSWEGYTSLCVKMHSLFIFPSLILSVSHSRGTKTKGRGRGRSLSPGQGAIRWGPAYKSARKHGGGNEEKKKNTKKKTKNERCLHVLCSSPLAAVSGRMAGGCLGGENGCLV